MFELTKQDLQNLNAEQLRELVARLCEAELAAQNLPRSAVRWGGAQTAPDGGLDVEVRLTEDEYRGDFVPRMWTGIQVKKHAMGPAAITKEMAPAGNPRPILVDIVTAHGAYLIVSLDDDPTGIPLKNRHQAMATVVASVPGVESAEMRFLGRNELTRWLSAHPGVQLWARKQLNLPLQGWKPFGNWTSPPVSADDTFIVDEGAQIRMPSAQGNVLGIVDGINAIRELVRASPRAIRIVGLSGVGKTRIVQALFEEDTGTSPLDPSTAIYADLGDDLTPTANELVERLVNGSQSAILVLDNCPSEVHSRLSQKVAGAGTKIRLITVEYDIRDDKPERTDVIRIEATGLVAVEKLIKRRFPQIDPLNTERIARFSQGNARLALALAERLELDESISTLSDETLFNRLFFQRDDPDNKFDLRQAAEILSLVYSYSVEADSNGDHELDALSSISGSNRVTLYGVTQTLLARQLAQKRGPWRAILPHAISNRLAAAALDRLPIDLLRAVFEAPRHARLLRSFSHRIGYLHNHEIAEKLVTLWLSPGGYLANLSELNSDQIDVFLNVAPAAPEAVLYALEQVAADPQMVDRITQDSSRRKSIFIDILYSIAYEERYFDRCVTAISRFASSNPTGRDADDVEETLSHLFYLYLSGTAARPEFRLATLRRFVFSSESRQFNLGLRMLCAALDTGPWSSLRTADFGAWPRDYGYMPKSNDELADLYIQHLKLVSDALASATPTKYLALHALFARHIRGLWRISPLRTQLTDLAQEINARESWIEGWRAVRETLYFDYRKAKRDEDLEGLSELTKLSELLRPKILVDEIRAYVLDRGSYFFVDINDVDDESAQEWENREKFAALEAERLGRSAAHDKKVRATILPELFSHINGFSYHFGKGLGQEADDPLTIWKELALAASQAGDSLRNFGVALGVFDAIKDRAPQLAHELLDDALSSPILRKAFVDLQGFAPIDARAVKRLKRYAQLPETDPWSIEPVLWRKPYDKLSERTVIEIVSPCKIRPNGARILLHGLSMRFHDLKRNHRLAGPTITKWGLLLSQTVIREWDNRSNEPELDRILSVCLRPAEFPHECNMVLRALLKRAKDSFRFSHGLRDALKVIVSKMPDLTLDAIFKTGDTDEDNLADIFQDRLNGSSALDDIPVQSLISWAEAGNKEERLKKIAGAIWPFASAVEGDVPTLSKQANALILASRHPREIIFSLGSAVAPMSWSGSRANIIAERTAVFFPLMEIQNPIISEAARDLIIALRRQETHEREWERRNNERREQTFE